MIRIFGYVFDVLKVEIGAKITARTDKGIVTKFRNPVFSYQHPICYLGTLHWPPYSPYLISVFCSDMEDLVKEESYRLISLKISIIDSFPSIKRSTWI